MVTPRSKSWIVLFVLSSIVSSIRIRDGSSTEIIPAAQSNVNTQANFISISYGLDDQHVQPINASAYEWYYLDAVSSDGQYSIVFTFYTVRNSPKLLILCESGVFSVSELQNF